MCEENKEPEINYCVNCGGYEPCWCDNKKYIKMWKFVYDAMKALNPKI